MRRLKKILAAVTAAAALTLSFSLPVPAVSVVQVAHFRCAAAH